ncbi:MAG: hypothetical protein QOI92_2653 [Chloroflexota bacterium]|nr:hypothetical protein [Chloroflexota bacterium]
MRSIVVVDDYQPFRVAVREMLERDGFRVIGDASDRQGAIESVRKLRPDVVLLDVHLPGDDGFQICEQLQQFVPTPAVILTSSHDVASFRRRLRTSRARGFIGKADLTTAGLIELLESGSS